MNRVLASLTARQLLGRRRTLAMAAVMAVPIAIALLYRFGTEPEPGVDPAQVATEVVGGLILTLALPLVALVLGTGSLGAEIADGTAVFLLTKPVERWRIIVVTVAVAAAAAVALVVPSTVASAWIIAADSGGTDAARLAWGLGLSAAVAAVLYCAVFVAVSARTSRALVIGLVYVFVWEVFATNLFDALKWLSIREYSVAWSQLVVTLPDSEAISASMSAGQAVVGSVVILVLAGWYGTYALSRFQVRESV